MLDKDFVVLDDRFRRYAMGNVHIEKLWTGSRWAEGPAYFAAGKYLIWSDIPNDRLLRYDETDGSVSVFLTPCNNHNGHTVDLEGRLISCEHRGRAVTRIEHDGPVCDAELTLRIMDFPAEELRTSLLERAATMGLSQAIATSAGEAT